MYEGLLSPVKEFVETLGYLPNNCPVEILEDVEASLAARVRDSIKRVSVFHPEVDVQLSAADATLEEVIVYGIKNREIEMPVGFCAVSSERGYQTEEKENLSDKEILRIWRKVHKDYGDLIYLGDLEEEMIRAGRDYRKLGPVIDFAKRVARAFSGK